MSRQRRAAANPDASVPVLPAAVASAVTERATLPLALIVVVGILLRLWYLAQPIRYDEAVTYLTFVPLSWGDLIADYRAPNNHILHSLLVKCFVALLGNEVWTIRLPAFLAGVAAIPLTYAVAKAGAGQRIALLAAALVSASGAMSLYSTNARGYTLVVDATLLLAWLAIINHRTPQRWHGPLYALVGGLGLWVIPTVLYSLTGLGLWFITLIWRESQPPRAAEWWRGIRGHLTASAGAVVVGILLYIPVLRSSGWQALAGNTFVAPVDSPETSFLLGAELRSALIEGWQLFTLGMSGMVGVIGAAAVVAGGILALRRTPRDVPIFLPMAVAGAVLVLLMHRPPPARAWLYLLPFLAIVAAGALAAVLEWGPMQRRWIALTAPVGLALTLALGVIWNGGILRSPETGVMPSGEAIANWLQGELRPGDHLMVGTVSYAVLAYWMERKGMDHNYLDGNRERVGRYLLVLNGAQSEVAQDFLRRFRGQSRGFATDTIATFPQAMVIAISAR